MRVIHHKYKFKILFIILLVSLPTTSFGMIAHTEEQQYDKIISNDFWSFQQYIDIDVDTSVLSQNLNINYSYAIPVNITYRTNLPEQFLSIIPPLFRNMFLFKQITKPFQTIQLTIIDEPDCVTVTLSDPLLNAPIVYHQEDYIFKTTLYINVHDEAPAQPYSIKLKSSVDSIGRLNSFTTEYSITFVPQFIPLIDLSIENQVVAVGSQEKIDIEIQVKNLANKKARITPTILSDHYDWCPTINYPAVDLNPDESETFILNVQPPQDFSGFMTFKLTFNVEIFPLHQNTPPFSYPLDIMMYTV